MRTEQSLNIIKVGEKLHALGLLAACDGNISCRLDNDQILITPSGIPKSNLREDDLALIDLEGQIIKGSPSSEKWLHLEVYKSCDKAQAVIHAHPPTAIAWSVARPDLKELPANCLSEVIPCMGSVPIAAYACPGTKDMATNIHSLLPNSRAIILARHGALTWGADLAEALNGMERIEHCAKILKSAEELGGITSLPDEEIEKLWELRKNIGDKLL